MEIANPLYPDGRGDEVAFARGALTGSPFVFPVLSMKPETNPPGYATDFREATGQAFGGWVRQLRIRINSEFDDVAAALQLVASRQQSKRRLETEAIVAILEDKRLEVMAMADKPELLYEWHHVGDQVRRLLFEDPRYKKIRLSRGTSRQRAKAAVLARSRRHRGK